MTKDEVRDRLFPIFGVYGWWLADYGQDLNMDDELVHEIMNAYSAYLNTKPPLVHSNDSGIDAYNNAIKNVMDAIDKFCEERNHVRPDSSVPKYKYGRMW